MVSGYEVDFSEISRIYRLERKSGKYTELRKDFYSKAREYLAGLENSIRDQKNRDIAAAGEEQRKEILRILPLIWRFRTRKICDMCIAEKDPAKIELTGLTDEEQYFLKNFVEVLIAFRGEALEGRQARKEETAVQPNRATEAEEPANGGAPVLLRVLTDVPRFSTEDGEFELKAQEIANIPERYAKVLIKRGVAKEILISASGKG